MSERRTEELLEAIRKRGSRYAAPDPWELLRFIRQLAEIVDDLETLETDRQEQPNQ